MRVAYILTAGHGGVLPKTQMQVKRGKLILGLPGKYAELASDRLGGRLRQLGRLVGRQAVIQTSEAAEPEAQHERRNMLRLCCGSRRSGSAAATAIARGVKPVA
jgi:hypothetical protein